MKQLLTAVILATTAIAVQAHSGGTDRNGCHTDHRTGEYHCHHGK